MAKRNRRKVTKILSLPLSQSLESVAFRNAEPSRLLEASPEASAVFIFSSFRSSSTWFWTKFRRAPTTLTFYEIFHDILERLTPETARESSSSSWDSKHPDMAPYFLEYLPLIQENGGVLGYRSDMAYKNFIPADGIDGNLSQGEQFYITGLLNHALSNNKIPVLSCTRSLGRARAFRKTFAGKNILLHRNLFHQWASVSGQAISGNFGFIWTFNHILAACKHDPFLSLLNDWFSDRVESPDDELMFQTFLIMQLYLLGQAYDSIDIEVDTSVLIKDANLRSAVESELSELISAKIFLGDCKESFEQSAVSIKSKSEFFDSIEQFTKVIMGKCSHRAADFVERMKNDALEEWSVHEFYTQRFRGGQRQKLAEAVEALNISNDKLEKVSGELLIEKSKANEEITNLTQREAILLAERESLIAEQNSLIAVRDELIAEKIDLLAERDALLAEQNSLIALREELIGEKIGLLAERDALLAEQNSLIAVRDELIGKKNGLLAEREELTGELNRLFAERDIILSVIERFKKSFNFISRNNLKKCLNESGFEESAYFAINPDLVGRINAIDHYINHGIKERRRIR